MRNVFYGALIGVALCGLVALGACSKSVPTPAPAVTSAPVVTVAPAPVVAPAVPVTTSPAVAPAKVVVKAKAKVAKKVAKADAEKAAYRTAFFNKAIYLCTKRLYEKIGPPPAGFLTELLADRQAIEQFANRCAQLGVFKGNDFDEFEGKI